MAGYGFFGYGAGTSSFGQADGGSFPNPFDDIASLAMPETMPLVLRLCEYVAMHDGTYFQALNRLVSYFVTNVEFDDISDDEQEKWSEYFNDVIDIKNWLHIAGKDVAVYGNAFFSVLPAFRRNIYCNKCRAIELPLSTVFSNGDFNFRWEGFKFTATCPKCKTSGEWKHVDRKVGDKNACIVKRWNPHDMEVLWDPFTDDCAYIWKIPEDYKKLIKEGKLFALERAPWEVIQCIAENRHMRFEDGVVFHMREPALAGIRVRGWGIPKILANFRQTWNVQVLRRYNEAIALDYIIPLRLICPESGSGGERNDPLLNLSMSSFSGQIRSMLRKRRRDPGAINVLPFPVKYQLLGGEARQLAPTDLLNQAMETQLNNIGIPTDLWRGSLQLQTAPVALRLFETSHSAIPHNNAAFVRFIVDGVARILSWEKPKVKLEPITHADDIAAQQAKLQLMMGGQVSPSTGLKSVRLDYRDEVKRMIEDQRYQAEQQAKSEKEMEGAAQMEQMVASSGQQPGAPGPANGGGQPAPGGGGAGPAAAGGTASQPAGPAGQAQQSVAANLTVSDNEQISPQELWQRADTEAARLLGMDAGQRNSELRKLKQSNPNIHPFVLQRIEQKRQEASQQGKSMVLQQTYGGGH